MNLKLVTQPSSEPLTLVDVERQVRLNLASESEFVDNLIKAVREIAEGATNRALITQTWELVLDSFPFNRSAIFLPNPPLQKVNFISYIDLNGTEQILSDLAYRVFTDSSPNSNKGYVLPVYGLTWPVALNDVESVKINFTCGYGPIGEDTALNVPSGILQWMLLNVANLFENRESVVIGSRGEAVLDLTNTIADGLIQKYRIVNI